MRYDLQDRTLPFAKKLLLLLKTLPYNTITDPVLKQLIRSVTSVGANYGEACGAVSKSDFKNKIAICKKEAIETEYWIKLLKDLVNSVQLNTLRTEAHELVLIFSKSLKTSQKKPVAF
jgi:four helix bundle protein